MTHETFNEIYDRCKDPKRGKLQGKFTFDDFVQFMEEYRSKLKGHQVIPLPLIFEILKLTGKILILDDQAFNLC